MKAVLLRTGSVPVLSPVLPVSPKVSLSRQDSVTAIFSREKNTANSPAISLHWKSNRRQKGSPIRRALSESDIVRSESDASVGLKLPEAGARSFPTKIPEDEENFSGADVDDFYESLNLKQGLLFGGVDYTEAWPESGIRVEELGFSGDGFGKGKKSGGGGNGGYHGKNDAFNDGDLSKIGEYYQQMLKSNPGDSLLLTNYAKYLHEVEGDLEKAEEYYGRAILASPGDAEVLSLYGKLIWNAHRDGERAKSYFDQAVHASPNDSSILGSYAHFMWEAEDEEQDKVNEKGQVSTPAMVAAF